MHTGIWRVYQKERLKHWNRPWHLLQSHFHWQPMIFGMKHTHCIEFHIKQIKKKSRKLHAGVNVIFMYPYSSLLSLFKWTGRTLLVGSLKYRNCSNKFKIYFFCLDYIENCKGKWLNLSRILSSESKFSSQFVIVIWIDNRKSSNCQT